jgi:DNA polymerase-3 subunit beta
VFDFRRGRLTVSCVNLDLGEAREEVEVQHAEKDLTAGFNARYVLDFLGVVDEAEVSIHLNDALSPALFRPLQGQDYSCVIMPMRL